MILVILAIFFTQFAVAQTGNISISGMTFLDKDSNKEFNTGDEPQIGIGIFIGANKDSKWDSSKFRNNTTENGTYSFKDIPRDGFVIVQPASQSQSFNPKYYDLKNLTTAENKLDFSISDQEAPPITPGPVPPVSNEEKKPDVGVATNGPDSTKNGLIQNTTFLYILVLIFLLIAAGGCAAIFVGLKGLYDLTKQVPTKEQKDNRITMLILWIASGFILLLLGMFLLMSLVQITGGTASGTDVGKGLSFPIVLPVVLALLLFGAVLLMLYTHTKLKGLDNESGGMRKTIAGLLVIGLIAVVLYALNGTIMDGNQDIITQYIQLVGIIIAFYFGSKATSEAYKGGGDTDMGNAQDDLKVEKATYDSKNDKILIKATNEKGRTFVVKTVKITHENDTITAGSATGIGSELIKNPEIVRQLRQGEKEKLDKDIEYDFVIETIPIGDWKFKSKIDMPADESAGGALPAAAEDVIREADEAIRAATKKKEDAQKIKNDPKKTQEEKTAADEAIKEADDAIKEATKKKEDEANPKN
jgi:hypothetical protein